MRIVLVNWAKVWDGASHGGGVNGYCQSLALEFIRRGHDVISLFGGTSYVNERPECVLRRHEDWLGVKVFEVVNSPVMAPSIVQFRRPMGEVAAPALERVVGRFFDALRPDVVHFHNIEGFSAGCVGRARSCGARVIYSLHNYHTICPQVYLMQGHRRPCTDYDNGHNCASCIDAEDPDEERRIRAAAWKKARRAEVGDAEEEFERAWGEFKHLFTWPVRVMKVGGRVLASRSRVRHLRADPSWLMPGRETGEAGRMERPLPMSDTDTRGKTQYILGELNPPPEPDPDDPSRRPLLNVIQPEPASDKPPNEYAKRRAAMIEMLNSCDRVLAVSDFVRRKFESMGVDERVIRTMHIGSRINRVVRLAPQFVFHPPPFERERPRPVRLVFIGYNHYYKGLPLLAEALELLTPDQLRRIDLSIHALDGETIEWAFRRLEPRLARLTFRCGYGYHDIPWILGGKDLSVVCSVWWDNAPQTVFESFACRVPVLGAEVGGIPDFVTDGVNGLLFRANDRRDLARRVGEIVADPSILSRLRENVRPPKDIADHAAELEALYSGA